MDSRPVLETLAQLLPSLPNVEDQLVTFDALVGVSDPGHRPEAAAMLRDAAESCIDPSRRERLLQAAAAVAAGQPCAFTPEGLTAQQAAASQTITKEEWERRIALNPLPEPPSETDAPVDEEDDDILANAPPKLPHLPVRCFFPGLAVRVAQPFTDSAGRQLRLGEALKLVAFEETESGFVLHLLVRNVRLIAGNAENDRVIQNENNAWLEPVPSVDCLGELWEAVNSGLTDAEDDETMDDHIEQLERLREDVDACADWIGSGGTGAKPPDCRSEPLAARVFGREHAVPYWVRLLFAGIQVALPDE